MSENPYDRPSDPAKRNSAVMTDGPEPRRARDAQGGRLHDEDLARPIIGVATTWIETMPCNFNQRALAQKVKRAFARPAARRWSSTPSPSPTASRWAPRGCAASLVSREVIADSIELVGRGHHFDGLVCLVGCDKTIPAAAMALARLDIPGLVFYNGSIAPGRYEGSDVTIQDVFEGVGALSRRHDDGRRAARARGSPCPGAGACGGQFTANTMATALEFLGISPAGLPASRRRTSARPTRRRGRPARDGRRARGPAALAS